MPKKTRKTKRIDGMPVRRQRVNSRDRRRLAKWLVVKKQLVEATREMQARMDEVMADYKRKGEVMHSYNRGEGEFLFVKPPKEKKTPQHKADDKKGGK